MRHHVAVNELGWTIPNMETARDKDEFDHDETIYFVELDAERHVIATARLNPTTRPHLMTEIFQKLCEFNGVPVGEDIYEYSRFLVKKSGIKRRTYANAQAHISLSIVEYCLAANIKQVTWVTYKRSYPLALRMWKTRPLGLPRYFASDDADYIAAISDMSEESLKRTRDLAHIQRPVCEITLPLEAAPQLTQLPARSETYFG